MYDKLPYQATTKCFFHFVGKSMLFNVIRGTFNSPRNHSLTGRGRPLGGEKGEVSISFVDTALTSPTALEPSLPETGCGIDGSMDQSMNGAASNEQRSMLSTWWLIRVSRFVEPPHRFITTVASFRDCVREEADPNGVPNRA